MSTTARSLPLLTTSSSRAYRACNRLYYFSTELGYRPAYEDPAMAFGTLGHLGLEAWWRARGASPDEPAAWLAAGLAEVGKWDVDEFTRAAHRTLMYGYDAQWAEAPLVPLAVEHEYTLPLINPATGAASRTWQAAGKIDVIVRNVETGEVFVLDHKYTSSDFSPGSDYRSQLTLDSQVSNYLAAVRRMGLEPAGWIHDCIQRPGQRPLKAVAEVKYTQGRKSKKTGEWLEAPRIAGGQRLADETPEEYGARIAEKMVAAPDAWFARIPVVRLADEEREAAFDLYQVGVQIRESRNANMWPRNPASCFAYNRACAFLPVCNGQASLEDGTRYRRATRAHEELGSGVQSSDENEGVEAAE